MLCGSLDGRGVWGENGYTYMYRWVPLLPTWNYLSILNQLYSNIKLKVLKQQQQIFQLQKLSAEEEEEFRNQVKNLDFSDPVSCPSLQSNSHLSLSNYY